ncbi:MAG TPA: acyl carrier protein [Ardenticatenaceae bacterium]|jgi:acyl carrier protein
MDRETVSTQLRDFIRKELLKQPNYPMTDDEPLITGGVLSSFYLVQVALFIENTFGVYLEDAELTAETMDTLRQMTDRIMGAPQ